MDRFATEPSPSAAQDSARDPELDAFVDSLVWDEWEPGRVPSLDDPPTLNYPIQIVDPSTCEFEVAPDGVDPSLKLLIDVWPDLPSMVRQQILELVSNVDPSRLTP